MEIVNFTHKDFDGVVCSILLNDYCNKKGYEFTKLPCTYRNIDDAFKRYYNEKNFFFITDISLNNEKVIVDIEQKKNIFIIDHHERDGKPSLIQRQILDTNKGAGCKLVFNFLEKKGHHFSDSLKKLMILGDDFDTWNHKYKLSKHLNRLFYYYNFKDFFERFRCGFDGNFLEEEKKFIIAKQKEIDEILRTIRFQKLISNVAFVPRAREIDEIAEYILYKFDFEFVVIYNVNINSLSFRSNKNSSFHLGKILKEFGGGGHVSSGGLTVENEEAVLDVLEKFCNIVGPKDEK